MLNGGKAGLTPKTETRAAQRVTVEKVDTGFNIYFIIVHHHQGSPEGSSELWSAVPASTSPTLRFTLSGVLEVPFLYSL